MLSGASFVVGSPLCLKFQSAKSCKCSAQDAGPGIGRVILDHAIFAAERGKSGKDGLLEAVRNGLTDRAARGARQVEEHYCRKSSTPRAQRVRVRIGRTDSRRGCRRAGARILFED